MTAIEIPTPDPRTLDDESRLFAEAIAPQYALKRELGRGGMGVVYLARDKRLDRPVAIKMLPVHLAKDANVRERFLRETRTAGAMSHPNIVPIHSANEADGYVYFVMPYVKGDSLATRIASSGQLPARSVAGYLRDVAAALSHAHGRGIIHRDIKAENVLIERESERAMVTDFGIARIAEATPLTVTGQVLGTVYYVSPEQVTGSAIDARSDIYSLGVVGFLALTGRFPFEGDVASAVLVSHVTKTAPPVSVVNRHVPSVLATIVDRCLMKDPEHRFASASDMVAALTVAIRELEQSDTQAPPPAPLATNTEAHSVWKRAAELQALTGVHPRPQAVARPRDPSKNRPGGMGISVVRDAALEAGIDEAYVQHALVEHGLTATERPTPPTVTPPKTVGPVGTVDMVSLQSTNLSRRLVYEFTVNGQIAERDLDRFVNMLRDDTGKMGRSQVQDGVMAWWTGRFGTRLKVAIEPVNGQTTFRIVKSRHREVAFVLAVSVTVVGFISAGTTVGVLSEIFRPLTEEVAVISALIAAASSVFWSARAGLHFFRTRAENKVKALGDRLANRLRETLK